MKLLVIQTAFLGDVILATSLLEKIHSAFPDAWIDFLLKKGNEGVLEGHPFVRELLLLDKKSKWKSLLNVSSRVSENQYDLVINVNRFGSSGYITWRSGAKEKTGFDKNPFSFCYTKKMKHEIGNGKHEIERNNALIAHFTDPVPAKPKLYFSEKHSEKVRSLLAGSSGYVSMAPASVWFTKQFPKEKWVELIRSQKPSLPICLIGAESDFDLCEEIRKGSVDHHPGIQNLAGKLSILETAALMKGATMNYVNDSAPLHIASAVNAPVTAFFCSTVTAFGFGPLSDRAIIAETKETLTCRPCGLHGHKACPEGHFKCAHSIQVHGL